MKMTRHSLKLTALAAGITCALPAFAQSSVTMFGIMDTGVTYVSNVSGKHLVMMDDGVNGPNLWGLHGSEDLGGGTRATFELVNQYHIDSGAFMPGGSLFTRGATIGLNNDRFGSLKLGNQYDFMTDTLFFSGDEPGEFSGHFYSFRMGPFQKLDLPTAPAGNGSFDWDRMAGEVVSNTVKYVTPDIHGFSAGAMYKFGGQAGSIGAGNGVSFGASYKIRDFNLSAAYTNLKYIGDGTPDSSVRNWGVGAHYVVADWTLAALFTTVHNSANGAAVWQGSAGARYRFTPALSVGGTYMYMKGNAVVDNNHAHQIAGNVSYALSKRTEIYALGVYQRANSGANAQINGIMNPPTDEYASSGNTQAVLRVGLHTRF